MKRRALLTSAAAAGTAAVGLSAAGRLAPEDGSAQLTPSDTAEPIVAYVSDPASGKVVVMVGANEVVRTDRGLVADLSAIAKEAGDVVSS